MILQVDEQRATATGGWVGWYAWEGRRRSSIPQVLHEKNTRGRRSSQQGVHHF
jgi:hypothetical protein